MSVLSSAAMEPFVFLRASCLQPWGLTRAGRWSPQEQHISYISSVAHFISSDILTSWNGIRCFGNSHDGRWCIVIQGGGYKSFCSPLRLVRLFPLCGWNKPEPISHDNSVTSQNAVWLRCTEAECSSPLSICPSHFSSLYLSEDCLWRQSRGLPRECLHWWSSRQSSSLDQ